MGSIRRPSNPSRPDPPVLKQRTTRSATTSPRASMLDDRTQPKASSSTSSSQSLSAAGKADQVVHRVYLKTVGVLVEGRLTHYGGNAKGKEVKKDKWFNLVLPEYDLHRDDLKIYSSISTYSTPPPSSSRDRCAIPPLLIAFILDTSDIPNGQALLWNRGEGRIPLDTNLISGKGKGKERDRRSGIVLERWTFRATAPPSSHPSAQPAPLAYRYGIIHFRALYSMIRLLPAYRLFRRLRRAHSGLKLGIKLWGTEGYPNSSEGITEAWQVMERDLIGLDIGLHDLATSETEPEQPREAYSFPPLDLFGLDYNLQVDYRPEIDFQVEDMEAVLSEKFVDMDEDWFTPTVARHREESAKSSEANPSASSVSRGSSGSSHSLDMSGLSRHARATSGGNIGATPIPGNPSPIPYRQPGLGSYKSPPLTRPLSSRVPSDITGSKEAVTPGSLGKWGALGEGLPFAKPPTTSGSPKSPGGPPSPSVTTPSGATVIARRLSGQSIHPASPLPSSMLRSGVTPPLNQRPGMSTSKPSSIGRTSSFLSQSGRSFSQAQAANLYAQAGSYGASPIIPGMNASNNSLVSPEFGSPPSLSFSKQPIPRSSLSGARPTIGYSYGSSIPGSLDRDANILQGSPGNPPQIIKRLSSYSARRERLAQGSPNAIASSGDSDPSNLRRSSTRQSYGSSLKRSLEAELSEIKKTAEDSDDIEAFLKTLDSLPQPPSVAALAVQSSRSHLPSTSSSLSVPSKSESPIPLQSSSGGATGETSPGDSPAPPARTPVTRAQIDDQLRKMAGSFQLNTSNILDRPSPISGIPSRSSSIQGISPSVGLLSASRPGVVPRKASTENTPASQSTRSSPSALRPTSVKTGSPLSQEAARAHLTSPPPDLPPSSALRPPASQAQPIYEQTTTQQPPKPSARSLPGPGTSSLHEENARQLRSVGMTNLPQPDTPSSGLTILSPQTTGGMGYENSVGRSNRRGPVLLRGGFETTSKTSVSSSPSHSPIRDFRQMNLNKDKDRDRDETPIGRYRSLGVQNSNIQGISLGSGARSEAGRNREMPRSVSRSEERGRKGRVRSEGEEE